MSLHTVYVTKRGFLKVQNNQLVIEGHSRVHVPVEDISSLVIESQQVTITSACLSVLAQYGCNVIICDKEHKPSALQLPFLSHSRQAMVNRDQLQWNEAFKKRAHQKIVQYKLANQSECCRLLGLDGAAKLKELSRTVKLDDKNNNEACGASLYFSRLLNGHGRRERGYFFNKALNYGYAIVRSQIARELTVAGFLPSVGLFHRSELNNYNLADDMIEPFRPFVDFYVMSHFESERMELDTEAKCALLKLPEMELLASQNERILLSQSVKNAVQSLRKASRTREAGNLCFPKLCVMRERKYE